MTLIVAANVSSLRNGVVLEVVQYRSFLSWLHEQGVLPEKKKIQVML